MGEREILWFFYCENQADSKRYYSVRDVSKALKQEYSSVHKQMKRLWFIDYLIVRRKRLLSLKAAFFNSSGMYKLNGEKIRNCQRIFSEQIKTLVSDVPINKSTYLSSKSKAEEKKSGMEGVN